MRKKILLAISVVFALVTIVIGIIHYRSINKEEQYLNIVADNALNGPYLKEYILNTTYETSENGIQFSLMLESNFANLSPLEQYGILDACIARLRYYLNGSDYPDRWITDDILLSGVVNGHTYDFKSVCWNKDIKVASYRGTLFIDGEVAYTHAQYEAVTEEHIAALEEEFIKGYSDLEISNFFRRTLDLITYGGMKVNPVNDFPLVVEAVVEHFNITEADFYRIYRKYFLLYR